MSHKFSVGQTVVYRPVGGKTGEYVVTRKLPEEPQSADCRYRIKSAREGFERNVNEYELSVEHAAG